MKLALSASLPLMVAIFTIVSYVQQMQITEQNRQKDERMANATREKDLEIANLTRIQDQLIANMTRHHDLQIANLTQIKDWEIASANLHISNETKIQDRQIAEENRNEDRTQQQDLHHETVYSKYIEDISAILYKQPQNQSTFTSEHKKMLYIRRKTLITLRSIDNERRSQLFIFLYENNLLPDQSLPLSTISLIGADLRNISIESPVTGPYEFNSLSLQSANLINAAFIGCTFRGRTNFTGSIMTNVVFIGAVFEDKLTVYEARLGSAAFINCTFRKEIEWRGSDLRYAKFVRSNFDKFSLENMNLINASFIHCQFGGKINFIRTAMHGSVFHGSIFEPYKAHQFNQVSLDYSDFRNTSIRDCNFQNCNVSYSNFSGSYFRNVQFYSKTFLINADFRNSTLLSTGFSQTNLTGANIDFINDSNLELENVVLPNGTWSMNGQQILRNGDPEAGCWWSAKEDSLWNWKGKTGSPVLYHHNITHFEHANSMAGNCSFKCADENVCVMGQLIDLSRFMLFIDTGKMQYTVSIYFGTDTECAQGLIHVLVLARRGSFKRQFVNPYLKSSNNSIRWLKKEDTYTLPTENVDFFYVRVIFNENSASCFIDNIEFRLEKKVI